MVNIQRVGRPPKQVKATERVHVRITKKQKIEWKAAAENANMSLSEWIKQLVDQEVRKE